MKVDIEVAITDGKFRTAYEWTLLGYGAGQARLALAEEKLKQFEIEWDGEKYAFSPNCP